MISIQSHVIRKINLDTKNTLNKTMNDCKNNIKNSLTALAITIKTFKDVDSLAITHTLRKTILCKQGAGISKMHK